MNKTFKKTSEEEKDIVKKSFNQRISKKIVFVVLAGLLIIVGGSAFYLVNKNNRLTATNVPLTAEQSQKLIEQVGKLIELPTGEEPILATVSDVSLLPKEPFYERAQNGDRVLIFKSSKMAILYRPSTNKIIKVGTVSISEPEAPSATSSAALGKSDITMQEQITVAILNGTKISGYAKTTGDSLEAKFQNISVVGTGNAERDYSKTLVVDVSGKNKSAAQTLVKELSGEIGSLPEGETVPSGADILVILGNQE